MKKILALSILTLNATTIIAEMPESQAVQPMKAECAGSWAQLLACQLDFESALSGRYPDLFTRNGESLTLQPRSKGHEPRVLNDTMLTYRVIAYYPKQDLSVISLSGHEYFDMYAYHHEYGTYFQVFDTIRFSPSQRHLVAFNCDLESDFSPNAVAIYRLDPFVRLAAEFNLDEFCVTDASFDSETSVSLGTEHYGNGFVRYKSEACRLVEKFGVWQFLEAGCFKNGVTEVKPR